MGIRLKRSGVAGKAPVSADLEPGELAVNTYDGKLYLRRNDGADAIVEVGPVRSVAGRTGAVALAIADVASLQTALDGKAASSHTHGMASVAGLQAALDAKADDSEIATLTTSLNTRITAPASLEQGDMLFYNGSAWARLAAGTSGQVLSTGGPGANPVWTTLAGDVFSYDANNVTSVVATNLGIYRAVRVTFNNLRPASNGAILQFGVSTNNGASFTNGTITGNSIYRATNNSNNSIATGSPGTSLLAVGTSNGTAGVGGGGGGVNGGLLFTNFNQPAHGGVNGSLSWQNDSGSAMVAIIGALLQGATARNAIRFLFSTGNIAAGSISVEGLR